MDPVAELRAVVEEAAGAIAGGGLKARPTLERPKQAGHGDYSTNVAMLLAPAAGAPPREVAEQVGERLRAALGDRLADVQIAGPGFLNLVLADALVRRRRCAHVLDAGDAFGSAPSRGETAQVEFVSANPTGPLTAASGRHAAFGDAVARLLTASGYDVSREYYFNDAGSQVLNLGLSIQARARGEEPPEDGYQGDYVVALAEEIPGAAEAPAEELAARGIELLIERIRATLHAYRVDFDSWFSEARLHPEGIAQGLERVAEHSYRHDNALWLRTTTWGDDKDRVLAALDRRADVLRGRRRLHARQARPRLRAAGQRAGLRSPRLHRAAEGDHVGARAGPRALRHPHPAVRAPRGGRRAHGDEQAPRGVRHARRADRRDRRRRHALVHAPALGRLGDRPRPRSRPQPVGREPRLLRAVRPRADRLGAREGGGGAGRGRARAPARTAPPGCEPAERALVKKLLAFPGEVAEAAARRAPHRIASYALELAQDFTAFYRDCRVVGAEPEPLESFRIALSVATKRTIAAVAGPAGRLGARGDVALSARRTSGSARGRGCRPRRARRRPGASSRAGRPGSRRR